MDSRRRGVWAQPALDAMNDALAYIAEESPQGGRRSLAQPSRAQVPCRLSRNAAESSPKSDALQFARSSCSGTGCSIELDPIE
jgi:hypothetical protein